MAFEMIGQNKSEDDERLLDAEIRDLRPPARLPVSSVFYMLCYVLERRDLIQSVSGRACGCDNSFDLLAFLFAYELKGVLKRGLKRDYVISEDELSSPRGKIRIQASLSHRSQARCRLVCSHEQYTLDNVINGIARWTIDLIVARFPHRHNIGEKTWHDVIRLREYLGVITPVEPTREVLREIVLCSNNKHYRTILILADLIRRTLMPDETSESDTLSLFEQSKMPALFEAFLRSFYRAHLADTDYSCKPGGEQLSWLDIDGEEVSDELLPLMRTDISITRRNPLDSVHAGPDKIIIDAKYYSDALSSSSSGYYANKAHPGNLYQVQSYMLNSRLAASTPKEYDVRGCLIYPLNGRDVPDTRFGLAVGPIWIVLVDMTAPWQDIEKRLLAIFDEIVA